ncbi:MAG: hypothetical protein AXW12_00380 [Thalassospira sp. Nap_22]|nr:MAG: hypothetical protein AXW12_00380 [Thalassospira sp. Nap_22]
MGADFYFGFGNSRTDQAMDNDFIKLPVIPSARTSVLIEPSCIIEQLRIDRSVNCGTIASREFERIIVPNQASVTIGTSLWRPSFYLSDVISPTLMG